MAVPTKEATWGICKTDAERESVARTQDDASYRSNVKSVTKNLRLAYANQSAVTYDSNSADACNIAFN